MRFKSLLSAALLSLPLLALNPYLTEAAVTPDGIQIYNESVDGVVLIQNDVSIPKKPKKDTHAIGTGFFVEENLIVTNAHVLEKDTGNQEITIVSNQSPKVWKAKVLAKDDTADIALLQIVDWDTYKRTTKWHVMKFAPYSSVQVGEPAFTLGMPWGFDWTLSQGIISGKDRNIDNTIKYYIQTDARLYQGNSGGPLIDANGDVLGINEIMVTNTGGSYGFSIPSDIVLKSIDELKRNGRVTWPAIGAGIKTRENGLGIDIDSIVKDSPAERAGLKVGDTIEFVKTRKMDTPMLVRTPRAMTNLFAIISVGDTVTIFGHKADGKEFIANLVTTVERAPEKKERNNCERF
jgi:serine protease Do